MGKVVLGSDRLYISNGRPHIEDMALVGRFQERRACPKGVDGQEVVGTVAISMVRIVT